MRLVADLTMPFRVARQVAAARQPGRQSGRRVFTRSQMVAAIQRWVVVHGELPSVADWEPSRARRAGEHWRAARFESGDWPSVSMLRREFGTLSEAIRAAGFRPRAAPTRICPKLTSAEEVLRAIREWNERYGEPPTMADWEPSRARRQRQAWRIERYARGDWPSARTVRVHFGGFTEAVAQAGLVPRRQGLRQPARVRTVARNRELAEYHRQAPITGFGPNALAGRVRGVASAQGERDELALHAALVELAGSALRWADQLSAPADP
jgi:hypothetical protein